MTSVDESLPLFSVSEFTTWHLDFDEDLELYKKLGLGGMEVCERKLSPDPGAAREQLASVRESGIRVTSVQPRIHALFEDYMCPDLKDPEERLKRYRGTIDLFSEAFPGENIPLVTISGKAPDFNFSEAHATARRLYPDLADYAADRGIRVMYEPLSPVLMNMDTFICTLTEAMDLIEAVDRPNFGLMLDVWHIWREPAIYERIEALGDRIFGVHVSDWPRSEPRHPSDRVNLGEGRIDWPPLLRAIENSGYCESYCLEIFSFDELPDSLWKIDPADLIKTNRKAFNELWKGRK